MKLTRQMLLSGVIQIFVLAPLGWYSLVLFHMPAGVYIPSITQVYGLFFSMIIGALFWGRRLTTFSKSK